ncbi:hypothetical protein [Croceicoccus naphthovorans]|uniref:Uncharacterized protein n=1 Tax=Croceicoccus naphthovorans TaxID=1348774 RepID=A0A0G3XHK0_9SPHN|nr:hypothetical protein [Croceicoccus naphthovorans]AKM10069.1 hypothetical protein AB433_08920 [Croceicoccus naphthovorans]MBB3991213.1 hypothetical protein [Croceicoccus naphthovorans]
MLPAIDRRTAPASPLTLEQSRKRFWWGVANPTDNQRTVMFAVLSVEAVWLGTMVVGRLVG